MTIKRLLPLLDRVLVQRVKAAERTASGLFIPEKAVEQTNQGIVIECGPGIRDSATGKVHPCSVAKGDSVLLPPYGGNEVKVGSEEYLLFKDSEILGKFE